MAIIAFGLYQAWMMNRGEERAISEPFGVGSAPELTLKLPT